MFYSRRYDFSTPHSNKEFIEDCTWYGWCRDNCPNKKIKVIIEYDRFENPIRKYTEPVEENRNYCISFSLENIGEKWERELINMKYK